MKQRTLIHSFTLALLAGSASAATIGDGPVVESHMDQAAINAGRVSFEQLFAHGQFLFKAKFNMFDGQSRPGTTGGGAARTPGSAPRFIRTSAPDANSCFGCHNDPVSGGGGDIVANVFVLAQTLDPVTQSVSGDFSNERNTLGMQGTGAIEMLAREMTAELLAIREDALRIARETGRSTRMALVTKDVDFGFIGANADGTLVTREIVGVNSDLIVRPFHQKGAVISLREFTNNAMNHHHGIQSVERFGQARTNTKDFDQDGVEDELTVGDVTATTIYQAGLNVPGQVLPSDPAALRAVIRGERTFETVGCADCHVPTLKLDSAMFTEPNPYNPDGNLKPSDVPQVYAFDMTTNGQLPRHEKAPDGGIYVRAYTDLKRHNLCDTEVRHFCNEKVVQGGIPTELFLTRRLWDVGNSAPYGHRGDLTTITEAIMAHGGEAKASRVAFDSLSTTRKAEVIEFLKSLQILMPGTPSLVVDKDGKAVDKAQIKAKLAEAGEI
ncbi:MAG: di-heme oxidoredictase family protein [Lysobacterales bacterium]